jgi:hypothetical protein
MNEIQYFLKKAISSCRKGKFYYRPWKQLLTIILLQIKCRILTGKTLDKL